MKILYSLVFCFVYSLSSLIHAGSCDSDEYDKGEYFAEKAGIKMVDKYGGGRNIRVIMRSCKYNSYSGKFKIKIEIYWDGSMFSDNRYNIDGELKLNSDGDNVEFSETYANDNVKDIRFWGYVVGGAVVLGAIATENQ